MTDVLIIDDDKSVVELYRRILDGTEFLVTGVAYNGRDGIKMAQEIRPSLIILDLSMPDEDGLEVLLELKTQHNKVPVAVVSGFSANVVGPLVEKLGAEVFVQKGTSPDTLLSQLRHATFSEPRSFLRPSPQQIEDFKDRLRDLL